MNNKYSFTNRVLFELRNGVQLSAIVCANWMSFPSTKLTSRISDLRSRGWPIQDKWEEAVLGKKYKVYYMKKGAKQK